MKLKAMSNATSITILSIAVLTIWSELSKPFKTFLAGLTGHHWTSKGIISIILFLGLYFIFPKDNKNSNISKQISIVLWATIISTIIIFSFYSFHFLGIF